VAPLAAPFAAHAQPVTGPYVSLGAGTSIANPFNYQYRNYPDNGKFQTRPDYSGVAAIGYGFGNGFRVELGGDFLRNTFHQTSDNAFSFGPFRATGGENTFGPMVNALYDIPVDFPVIPYVGAGVGYQWTRLASHLNPYNDPTLIGGTEGSFAYDVIAGLSYPLPVVPGLSLTAEYRFMQLVQSRDYHSYSTFGENFGAIKFGQESYNTFLLGVRYQLFNPPPAVAAPAPAPAPVAAPAPAPARTFIVFFDWDKATLTPRATEIISEAASDSKTSDVTTLDVSGYTDTSGTADYNMGLSQRRAEAVASKLEADGVAASEIEIHAYGETHLLVATGPGVREPQNRRVEIVLQ
jgi:outer membrane protein OmpA-like peptidoglycan-associated protein